MPARAGATQPRGARGAIYHIGEQCDRHFGAKIRTKRAKLPPQLVASHNLVFRSSRVDSAPRCAPLRFRLRACDRSPHHYCTVHCDALRFATVQYTTAERLLLWLLCCCLIIRCRWPLHLVLCCTALGPRLSHTESRAARDAASGRARGQQVGCDARGDRRLLTCSSE